MFISSITEYIGEITGDHCGFQCNASTTDQIFAFIRYWREDGHTLGQYIIYLKND
jgi:hypothetical protein